MNMRGISWKLTLKGLDPLLIFLFELLQLLAWFLFVFLFISFGCCGFTQMILGLADHQNLRIGIFDELGFHRYPSEASELFKHPTRPLIREKAAN